MIARSDAIQLSIPARAVTQRRLPLLLPVVAPLTLLAAIIGASNIVQTDTWVALVSGREIAEHGLPSVNYMTVIAHGHRWVDQQWLAQLALYGTERVGGVGLVVALCGAAALAAFALAAAAAQRHGGSPLSLAFWVPAAFLAGPWGVQARTQSLALPLFALVLWLVLRDPDLHSRSSLCLLAVLCVWANVHGSVILGAVVVAVHALVALTRTGIRRLPFTLLALTPLTILASPYATQLPSYYRTMLLHPPYGRQIVEWQRTTPVNAPFFFGIAGLAAIAVVARRQHVAPARLVVLAVTFLGALSAVRLTPWFALAALAVVPPLTSRRSANDEFRAGTATVIAAAMLAAIGCALAWSGSRDYNGPNMLAARLQAEPASTLVYADLRLADWALWAAPRLRGRVAYDGRPELMTSKQFTGVIRFARLSSRWKADVAGYALLVTNDAIAARLRGHGWRSIGAAQGIDVLRRAR